MISKECVGRDAEGNDRSLIGGTIFAFAWSGRGRTPETSDFGPRFAPGTPE